MPTHFQKHNDEKVDPTCNNGGKKKKAVKSKTKKEASNLQNKDSKAQQLAELASNAAMVDRAGSSASRRRLATEQRRAAQYESQSEHDQLTSTGGSSYQSAEEIGPMEGRHEYDDSNGDSYSAFETQPGAILVIGPGIFSSNNPTVTTRTTATSRSADSHPSSTEILSDSSDHTDQTPLPDTQRYDSITTTVTTAKVVDEESERRRIIASAETEIRSKILSQVVSADATPIIDGESNNKSTKNTSSDPKRKGLVRVTVASFAVVLVVAAIIVVTILLINKLKSPKEPDLPPPTNLVCGEAIQLAVGDKPEFYTTEGAILTDNPTLFDTCPQLDVENGPPVAMRGIWFTVVGTGRPISASTCRWANFETQITVFRGGDCGQLECFDFDDSTIEYNDMVDCNNSNAASLTWPTVFGETYYVLVGGVKEGGTGKFILEVTETVENDLCETALGPLPTNNTQIVGSTTNATPERWIGGFQHGQGVWYWVQGTGKPLSASTCHVNTTFDTVLLVFSGEEQCGNHEHSIAYNDNACQGTQSSVTWITDANEKYLILVQGQGNSAGEFVLTVSEVVENDLCETAVGPIALPEPIPMNSSGPTLPHVSGTTEGSTEDFHAPSCNPFLLENGPGTWFSVVGTGNYISASTCAATEQNSLVATNNLLTRQLAVYSSPENLDCSILICEDVIELNPVDCGSTALAWKSQPTQTYYIHVHDLTLRGLPPTDSSSDIERSFELELTQVIPGSQCDYTIDIFALGYELVVGSFQGATSHKNLPSCNQQAVGPSTDILGVWYTLHVPAGSAAFRIDVCFSDATLFVFKGDDCDELECVIQDQCMWSSSESISDNGETFHVLVSPTYDPTTSFGPRGFEIIVDVQFDEKSDIPMFGPGDVDGGGLSDSTVATISGSTSLLPLFGIWQLGLLLVTHIVSFGFLFG